jgi:hypothetical protein
MAATPSSYQNGNVNTYQFTFVSPIDLVKNDVIELTFGNVKPQPGSSTCVLPFSFVSVSSTKVACKVPDSGLSRGTVPLTITNLKNHFSTKSSPAISNMTVY